MSVTAETVEALIQPDSSSGGLILRGSRCRNCSEVLFPALRDCPVCLEPDVMEDADLAGHGRIRDYVVAERGPEGFPVPYVQAWVSLDAGPVVFSVVETDDPRGFDLPLGTAVTLVPRDYGPIKDAFHGWACVVDDGTVDG